MKRRGKAVSLSAILTVAIISGMNFAAAQETSDETTVTGTVTDVTLYRGQAMVSRVVPIEATDGQAEVQVIVTDLPSRIVDGSLFAEGAEGVEVRAVRQRTRAVRETPDEEVRKIEDQIETVEEQIASVTKQTEVIKARTAYLDKLDGFVAPTAKLELSKGVLDPEGLEKITLFVFSQREEIAEQELEITKQTAKLREELSLLQRKRSEMTSGSTKNVNEAILFLSKTAATATTVKLNYLVSGCDWSPTYTIRAETEESDIDIECNAMISQLSGEDWKGVQLTLSTASPALSAAIPGLAAFPVFLSPTTEDDIETQSERDVLKTLQSIRRRQSQAVLSFQNTISPTDNVGLNWDANVAANEFQQQELWNGKVILQAPKVKLFTADNGPSLTYSIATPVSLDSRSDQQMVRIVKCSLPSKFYHVAVPVLTSFVYREAEVKNESDLDLLAGPTTVYLGRRFVGQSEIPTVARGQTLVIGFGADPGLRASRRLLDRSETIQGGNKSLTFKYQLQVENFTDAAAKVRLMDRIPHSSRTAEINVSLGDTSVPVSTDPIYMKSEEPRGILRFEVDVTSDEATTVDYEYSVEFDRQYSLSTVSSQQRQSKSQSSGSDPFGGAMPSAPEDDYQMEFEDMQRGRATF